MVHDGLTAAIKVWSYLEAIAKCAKIYQVLVHDFISETTVVAMYGQAQADKLPA